MTNTASTLPTSRPLLPLCIHRRFTVATFRNRIHTISARLIHHSTIALDSDELVLKTCASWQVDRG